MKNDATDTPTTNIEYLLLFRGTDWDRGLSPEEIQRVMGKLMGWFDQLHRRKLIKAAQPLGCEGKIVAGRQGRRVNDGVFVESKEAIGGYLVLSASSLEEAVAVAREHPCLEHGATVEVRPIATECPTFERARERLTTA
jgi:hypothetical protein